MSGLRQLVIEADDPAATQEFLDEAFGLGDLLTTRQAESPSSGFRGFTISLVVAQPADVDAFVSSALTAGASEVKPVAKSFWGYGGVVRSPDGTLWKVASSAKKSSGPARREAQAVALLLGVEDVKATKQFYVDRGLTVGKSFGGKYVDFDTDGSPLKLALYGRRAAAKDAGVAPEGTGSHRIVVRGDVGAFTDPDGFVWESPGS